MTLTYVKQFTICSKYLYRVTVGGKALLFQGALKESAGRANPPDKHMSISTE